MPDTIPRSVEEFAACEPYPGSHGSFDQPWVAEPASSFRKEDATRFWFLDFHWPRGLTPIGTLFLTDCYAWGAQLAATQLPLPMGNGLVPRLGGTHVYATQVPLVSSRERDLRSHRLRSSLPRILSGFDSFWSQRVDELEQGLRRFEEPQLVGSSSLEMTDILLCARAIQRRAWEIHFEAMYPLLVNYFELYGLCRELGVDPQLVPRFLQGHDNRIIACDRALWTLARSARTASIESLFRANPPEQLRAALEQTGPGQRWLVEFDTFLSDFGWRTDGIADVALAPWIEDPTPPLGTIKTLLLKAQEHDFDALRMQALEERDTAIELVVRTLSKHDEQRFQASVRACLQANFSWWNDEHNHYIDLRASIPMRRACLAAAAALGTDAADDTLFLFWDELLGVVRGQHTWAEYRSVVGERRAYYAAWASARDRLPPVLGAIPEQVDDPILVEIFGLDRGYLAAVGNRHRTKQITGLAASPGTVRGRARVLHDAGTLHTIEPAEILVCEATTPNWTPAFTKIAACVCDVGGSLTHAAIVAREYRVPCVVGTGVATSVIKTGDYVEVDGAAGTVRILDCDG